MEVERHEVSPIGSRVNTVVLAFTVVAGLVVSLRLFTRLFLTKVSGFEDVWIVLAMGFSIGLAATISEQTMHGLGKHMSQLSASERLTLRKSFWAGLWIYCLGLTTTKISILVQYLRIFPVRRFQIRCYCLLAIVLAYGTWAAASNIFICNPVPFSWNETIPGQCINRNIIWYTNSGVNIVQDLLILLLPMPLIRTLKISRSQKRGLIITIALGASVCVVSVIRLYTLNDVANTNDLSYANPALVTLSALEINVGIICACLPAMRPLLSLAMPKYFSDVAQYSDIAIKLDAEQLPPHKHVQASSHLAQHKVARTNTNGSVSYPSSPRPTLSRTPSGRFAVTPSRPNTAGRTVATSFISHSRSGSNVSIDIAAADARANGPRFQGRINPLRLSPITPFSPLSSRVLYPRDAYGMSSRKTSGTSSPVIWRPQTPVAAKPLPLTPFPVGGGG